MRIEQEAQHVGDDRWKWSVWVEGEEAELEGIEAVEYTLHATFPEPVRLVRDRETKFRLDSSGWGEFEINAHALRADGSAQHLKHWLTLEEADGTPPLAEAEENAPTSPPNVFVSYAAADATLGNALKAELSERGFHATSTDEVAAPNVLWESAIASAIDEADLVVGIFSDATSPWVAQEVGEAVARNVEVVPIAVGDQSYVPDFLKSLQIVCITESSDLKSAVDSVERSLMR